MTYDARPYAPHRASLRDVTVNAATVCLPANPHHVNNNDSNINNNTHGGVIGTPGEQRRAAARLASSMPSHNQAESADTYCDIHR